MRHLSKRLQVIFDLVPDGARIADIGTDHAYLPIALAMEKKAKNIIACDIREKPLSKARENIKKFTGLSVETRLGDGISPISHGEADTVIIAGMGGDVISHILSGCNWIKDENILLLLQPMTSAEILRKYLAENLFSIEKEIPVCDSGKVYTVMSVRYSGIKESHPVGFEFTGGITADSPDGVLYLEKQRKRISDCIVQISPLSEKKSETELYRKILNHIESVLNL